MISNNRIYNFLFRGKIFALVLGFSVFLIFLFLGLFSNLLSDMETRVMDLHFNLKQGLSRNSSQENVLVETRSPKFSKDIVIVGIDDRTLDIYGRWPFPRSYHAELLHSFSRIQNQKKRESSILMDILFNEISSPAYEDAALVDAIKDNGRILLQPQMLPFPLQSAAEKESNRRLHTILDNYGEISNPKGNLAEVNSYYGIALPLIPYGKALALYGHATYEADFDKIFRKALLIARYSEKIGELPIEDVKFGEYGIKNLGHIGWVEKNGLIASAELPANSEDFEKLISDIRKKALPRIGENNKPQYYLFIFEDHYLPSTPLTLALNYFNKTLDDIEVYYGSHILIPSPMVKNTDTGELTPYQIQTKRGGMKTMDEIRIPIDGQGRMIVNYMGSRSSSEPGGFQTFPVRSYSSYALSAKGPDKETWPKTKGVDGKMVLVGAFSAGMADDEKNTPMGLMYGVEMHANSLNTIVMDNFIHKASPRINLAIMLVLVLVFASLTNGIKGAGWSLLILFSFILTSFLFVTFMFESRGYLLDWGTPIVAIIVTYIISVLHRLLTAESDKRRIKDIFGQFVSSSIVEKLSAEPPELGGANVDVTVFFSDIRGFSHISERLTAQELVSLLNEYLTDMTDNLVGDCSGTLDKYIGDAIMAFWGAPTPQEDHAVRACKCALMQIYLLGKLNQRLKNQSGNDSVDTLDIGIGLNSGTCMIGYMGSEGRKNYTAMGDTVNLASRLEGVNKTYQTRIIISENTKELLGDEPFILRELDDIRVKGRFRPVTIYELVGYDGDLLAEMRKMKDTLAKNRRKRRKS